MYAAAAPRPPSSPNAVVPCPQTALRSASPVASDSSPPASRSGTTHPAPPSPPAPPEAPAHPLLRDSPPAQSSRPARPAPLLCSGAACCARTPHPARSARSPQRFPASLPICSSSSSPKRPTFLHANDATRNQVVAAVLRAALFAGPPAL